MDRISADLFERSSRPSVFMSLLPKSKLPNRKQIAQQEINDLRDRLQDALDVLSGKKIAVEEEP